MEWGCQDFRLRPLRSQSSALSETSQTIVQLTETTQSTHVCRADKNKGVRKARGGLELFIQLPMCEDTGCGRIWICFFKENPCILCDHRCAEQQEDMRMARGERLALMDVVENTRESAGKEQFQVAKQLWKTPYNRGANMFWTQSVCVCCVLGISQMSSCWIPPKSQVTLALSAPFYGGLRVRQDLRGESLALVPRDQEQWSWEQDTHSPTSMLVYFELSQFGTVSTLCVGESDIHSFISLQQFIELVDLLPLAIDYDLRSCEP